MLRKPRPQPASEGALVQVEGFDALEPIGSGGFSKVYRARQRGFDRTVALKVLQVGIEKVAQRQAFQRECRAMGVLSEHPNIVTVFNAVMTSDHRPCIVMEYFPGGTLGDRVANEGPIDADDAVAIGIQIAGALETAHRRGVIHRDIKPHNLFLSEYGRPAVGDFGISSLSDERTITGGGGGITIHYAPPELIEGSPASPASDVYSLAACLYTLVAGTKPFPRGEGQTLTDVARRVLVEPAPRLASARGPEALAEVLQRAMSKDPTDRPVSAFEFGSRLQLIQEQQGWARTPFPVSAVGSQPQPQPNPQSESESESSNVEVSPLASDDATATVRQPGVGELDLADVDRDQVPGGDSGSILGLLRPEWRRQRSLVLAATAVVLLVSGLVVVAAGVGRPESAGDDSPRSATTDVFFSTPSPPQSVELAADGASVAVTWEPSIQAVRYQVDRVDTGEIVEAEAARSTLTIEPGERPCVQVRAVGAGGKMSQPSPVVCLS